MKDKTNKELTQAQKNTQFILSQPDRSCGNTFRCNNPRTVCINPKKPLCEVCLAENKARAEQREPPVLPAKLHQQVLEGIRAAKLLRQFLNQNPELWKMVSDPDVWAELDKIQIPPPLQKGDFQWKLNRSAKWAWFKGESQVSGAYTEYEDATCSFDAHGFKLASDAIELTKTIRDHDEWPRLEQAYGSLSVEEIEIKLRDLTNQIAAHSSNAQREFNGNGGRRTSAAVDAQAVRDLGQEKLLLSAYHQERINVSWNSRR